MQAKEAIACLLLSGRQVDTHAPSQLVGSRYSIVGHVFFAPGVEDKATVFAKGRYLNEELATEETRISVGY